MNLYVQPLNTCVHRNFELSWVFFLCSCRAKPSHVMDEKPSEIIPGAEPIRKRASRPTRFRVYAALTLAHGHFQSKQIRWADSSATLFFSQRSMVRAFQMPYASKASCADVRLSGRPGLLAKAVDLGDRLRLGQHLKARSTGLHDMKDAHKRVQDSRTSSTWDTPKKMSLSERPQDQRLSEKLTLGFRPAQSCA